VCTHRIVDPAGAPVAVRSSGVDAATLRAPLIAMAGAANGVMRIETLAGAAALAVPAARVATACSTHASPGVATDGAVNVSVEPLAASRTAGSMAGPLSCRQRQIVEVASPTSSEATALTPEPL